MMDAKHLTLNLFLLHLSMNLDIFDQDLEYLFPLWWKKFFGSITDALYCLITSGDINAFCPGVADNRGVDQLLASINMYQLKRNVANGLSDLTAYHINPGSRYFGDNSRTPPSINNSTAFDADLSALTGQESHSTFSRVITRPRQISSGYQSSESSLSSFHGSSSDSALPVEESPTSSQANSSSKKRRQPRRRQGSKPQQPSPTSSSSPPINESHCSFQCPSQRQQLTSVMCGFCRQNNEPKKIYTSHETKDANGKVTCPILFQYVCPACGATGPNAHTRSYCPSAKVMKAVFDDEPKIQVEFSNFARTSRSSGNGSSIGASSNSSEM